MFENFGAATKGKDALKEVHRPEAIAARLSERPRQSYLKDVVFASVDGTVTTFAIVAGVAGAAGDVRIAYVLGLANLVADGFSMASGNFLAVKTTRDELENAKQTEAHHIDTVPEGEREEIRQIFSAKGFSGEILEEIVRIITRNRKRWIDTMIVEEHGLPLQTPSPLLAASTTFATFMFFGLLPLVPLFFGTGNLTDPVFMQSIATTTFGFFAIGSLKSFVLRTNFFRSVLETIVLGGIAALLAFSVGYFFR